MLLMSRTRREPIRTANGNTLGEQIRMLRKGLGMTQGELGSQIGASTRAICSYARDECEPPVQVLVELAGALDTSLDSLLGLKEGGEPKSQRAQRRWLRKIEEIQELPERKQRAVLQVLDMALKS